MKKEKSCGAVVYKVEDGQLFLLIEKMRQGHYFMPKGHVERGETEAQTAIREIKEETNLDVELDTGFRRVISYSPYYGCIKDVVFFVAKAVSFDARPQEVEVRELLWLPKSEAVSILTHRYSREVMSAAISYIEEKERLSGRSFRDYDLAEPAMYLS